MTTDEKNYNKTNIVLSLLIILFVLATVIAWYFLPKEAKNKQGLNENTTSTQQIITSTFKEKEKDETKNSIQSRKDEHQSNNTTTEKSLPKEYDLAVPFTPQAPRADWSQPWQDACEEAGVLMLDAYYKDYDLSSVFAEDEIKKMVSWEENKKSWGDSIEIDKIAELAEYYTGKKPKVLNKPTIRQIKKQIADGNPVLVVAYGRGIPNPYYSGDGPLYHVLIIKGYNESEFITNDPGTKRGENFKYKYQDLMSEIHDWNGGNVKQGEKKVLILI